MCWARDWYTVFSSLLPSPLSFPLSLAFLSLITLPLIFPRSHQSLLIYLPLRSHFCLSNTSPTVFFFLSMSVLILLRMLLFPRAVPRPGSVPVKALMSSLDTLVAFCLSSTLLSFPAFSTVITNSHLERHKGCRTPTKCDLHSKSKDNPCTLTSGRQACLAEPPCSLLLSALWMTHNGRCYLSSWTDQ